MIDITKETNKPRSEGELQEAAPELASVPESAETSPMAETVIPKEEVGDSSRETIIPPVSSPEIIESAGLGSDQPVVELDDAAKAEALKKMINGHDEQDPFELASKAGLG